MAKKLGRREKNEFKNREIRYLTACSSPLSMERATISIGLYFLIVLM